MVVGENTNLDDAQYLKKGRSPLLPARHQADFFVCDVFDSAFKGDNASMEHPVFSLSKKPDMKTRRYENGDKWAEIRPSVKGLATVFDRDILIYCISQLMTAINNRRPVSPTLRLKAHDLLIATNRDTSGRGYLQLREALERLQGTQIATNISAGGVEVFEVFGLINSAKIVRETRDGRMQDVEIRLSDWVFAAVEAEDVLTLDRRYFQLAKPVERRLYELARKHVGKQASFKIGLDRLQKKCGSLSSTKEFRRMLKTVIADDAEHGHMPGYAYSLDDNDMVIIKSKVREKRSRAAPSLETAVYEAARKLAPGWDIYALEGEWRAWMADKEILPFSAKAHFLAFCKKRGRLPGLTAPVPSFDARDPNYEE